MASVPINEKNKKSLVDLAIDALPFEFHYPTYQYLGPGTHLAERLARGEIGRNFLDQAALSHDLAYARNENRRQADRKLIEAAFSRLAASDTDCDERAAALITACCLVSKVTLEKFCSRVRKAFSGSCKSSKKKKKRQSIPANAGQKGKEKKARKKIAESAGK